MRRSSSRSCPRWAPSVSRRRSFATRASERAPYVAVVGAGDGEPELLELAEEVGAEIARRGAVLVCGGLGGVMEAACRGAKAEGGTTIGILPDEHRRRANPYLDVAIPTGLGELRNTLVVRCADVVIAIGGEYGTLSEIALGLKIGKAVVGLKTWELHKEGRARDDIRRAQTAQEAVAAALALVSR